MWPKQSVMEANKISGLNKNVGNILVCLRVDDDAERSHTQYAIRLEVCQWKSLQLLKLISFITSWKYLHVPEMFPAYLPQTVPAIKLFDDPFIHSSPQVPYHPDYVSSCGAFADWRLPIST